MTVFNKDFRMAVTFKKADELAEAVYELTKADDVSEAEKIQGLQHVNDLLSVTQNEDSTFTLWNFANAEASACWSNGSKLLYKIRHDIYKTKRGAVNAIKRNLKKIEIEL